MEFTFQTQLGTGEGIRDGRGREKVLVAQSCPTVCNPMDCSLPGSSVHGDSPAKNTGVGCLALLQGIFPTQGSNPGLLHCRWILYLLSHQGSQFKTYKELNQQGKTISKERGAEELYRSTPKKDISESHNIRKMSILINMVMRKRTGFQNTNWQK